MKWNVLLHLKYLWNSLKKENHCLHFTLKFEMQEAGYARGSPTGCKAAPALPSTCLYPPLGLRDLLKSAGRGDQPATFLAQLITETSPLLTLPLTSNL